LGRDRCGKINGWNSAAESCTGIGVVAGFADVVGMMESSHMKMAESVSCIRYRHTLQDIRAIGKTRNHFRHALKEELWGGSVGMIRTVEQKERP
jgi:hypothetical protein